MITCKLNGKEYYIDHVSGRALREIDPAAKMYAKLTELGDKAMKGEDVQDGGVTTAQALDVLVKWFCLVFNNQFTPDEVYDYYPVDNLTHDIVTVLVAVQNEMTEVLHEFPLQKGQTAQRKKTDNNA